MRKIILFIASSLDGFIAREDGSIDFLFTEGDYGYKKFLASVDTVLMGMKTYRQVLTFGDYPYREKRSIVFTREKKLKKDNNTEFNSDPVTLVKKLKKHKGKDIWLVGGSEIITVLMNAGLVDEIINSVHPILLGRGIPLFKDIRKDVKLKLVNSKGYESGLLQVEYAVLHE
jgi:dihydrofolate reductase